MEPPATSDPVQGGRQFAFLLVDKFSMFSLAAAIDTFRSANRLLGRDFYGWTTVSADGEAVMASNGIPIKIDYAIADLPNVDILFVAVNIADHLGIDAEQALRRANQKFRRRFGEVERLAGERGLDLKDLDLAGLDALWDEAKAVEHRL